MLALPVLLIIIPISSIALALHGSSVGTPPVFLHDSHQERQG
jgi:hypothetical protein